jgi:hypothetical protein
MTYSAIKAIERLVIPIWRFSSLVRVVSPPNVVREHAAGSRGAAGGSAIAVVPPVAAPLRPALAAAADAGRRTRFASALWLMCHAVACDQK